MTNSSRTGKSPCWMGKSTISTGPFSSSQTLSLPGRVSPSITIYNRGKSPQPPGSTGSTPSNSPATPLPCRQSDPPMVVPCRVSATRRAIRRSMNLGMVFFVSAETPWDTWGFNNQRYGDVENDLKWHVMKIMSWVIDHMILYIYIIYKYYVYIYMYVYIIDYCCIYVSPCVSIPFIGDFTIWTGDFALWQSLAALPKRLLHNWWTMAMSKFKAKPSISSLEKKHLIPCPNIPWSQSVESHACILILTLGAVGRPCETPPLLPCSDTQS